MPGKYFNPHFRKGSDYMGQRVQWWVWHFNPHFRKGSDQAYGADRGAVGNFNPHFRKGSDWFSDSRSAAHHYFNPHFRKGSDPLLMFHNFWKFYFNPHFRKGSDKIATGFPIERVISIHTSAREVTDGEWWEKDICRFQSTLPQGKWPMRTYGKRSDSLFQSTLPQGKWLLTVPYFSPLQQFQSTLPQGKWRPYEYIRSGTDANFNPHFRKGSDLQSQINYETTGHFNPHFRKGSDCKQYENLPDCKISIHTSAREVTTEKREACKYLKNFNPHFRKGSDDEEAYSIDDELNFNPHFRKGSDGDELKTRKMVISISIHTSAREVTPSTTLHDVLIRFQSTLPQGKWQYVWEDNEIF